jgi:hypothetical protein
MLDRETPVRNMIGALAMARQLDYRQTYDAFDQLNQTARQNLTTETFFAVKQREKEIITQGQDLAGTLLGQQFEIRKAINANDAAQHKARVIGAVFSILSTLLLLFASIATRNQTPEAAEEAAAAT